MKLLKSKFIHSLCFLGILIIGCPCLHAARSPIVSRIVPKSGPHIGGTRILIEGFNFDKNCIVKIGEKQCSFIKLYKTKKTAIILTEVPEGPSTLSSFYVTVTNGKGIKSPLNKDCVYTYIPPSRFDNTPYIPPVRLNLVR